MNANQLITAADLDRFKNELLSEIKLIVHSEKKQVSKQWLKSNEVCKLLDISQGKLQTMRNSKIIKFTRVGGTLFYDQEDIAVMMDGDKSIIKKR